MAASKGKRAFVDKLIEWEFNCERACASTSSLLFLAAKNGDGEMVDILIEHMSKVAVFETLSFALFAKKFDVVTLLIQHTLMIKENDYFITL